MELTIDFGEPVIAPDRVLCIQPSDLDAFYTSASDFDKTNLFFVLLTSLHSYEDQSDFIKAAHLSYLIAYYLFITLTPPGSCQLALHYIQKALVLAPCEEYRLWQALILRGN